MNHSTAFRIARLETIVEAVNERSRAKDLLIQVLLARLRGEQPGALPDIFTALQPARSDDAQRALKPLEVSCLTN